MSNLETFSSLGRIAVFLLTSSSLLAESTYEREMRGLREQRDKAVSAAVKSLNERYQEALEKVYRKAVAANDGSADAIKAELEALGPLRPQASQPAAPVPAARLLKSMIGKWKVVHLGDSRETWEFKADGTCAVSPGTSDIPTKFLSWSKNKDVIEVRDADGKITALELPAKSGRLEGTGPGGGRIWLEKSK